jgi:hypothetical protein
MRLPRVGPPSGCAAQWRALGNERGWPGAGGLQEAAGGAARVLHGCLVSGCASPPRMPFPRLAPRADCTRAVAAGAALRRGGHASLCQERTAAYGTPVTRCFMGGEGIVVLRVGASLDVVSLCFGRYAGGGGAGDDLGLLLVR